MGEDFLDLAIVKPRCSAIRHSRIDLRGLQRDVIHTLRGRILGAAPELRRNAIALIDSPRVPRKPGLSQRRLDFALRRLVARIDPALGLSMFPTPAPEYFIRCVRSADCKPHLAAIGRELLGDEMNGGTRGGEVANVRGGALFTRFMLAGFATYRALEMDSHARVAAFESYPALVFRLWADRCEVPPKSDRRRALEARNAINLRMATRLGIERFASATTLDQADAGVLALAAALANRSEVLLRIDSPGEGRFLLPAPAARFTAAEATS